MTTKTTQKDEGLLSFITTVFKRSVDLPSDVQLLANSVKVIAEELSKLSKNVSYLFKIAQEHDRLLSQVITIQAHIVNNAKSISADTQLPNLNGTKSEKPN